MQKHEAQAFCRENLHRYVMVTTRDEGAVDGFIEHVDDDYLYLAEPMFGEAREPQLMGQYPGIGHPGHDHGHPHGHPGHQHGHGYGHGHMHGHFPHGHQGYPYPGYPFPLYPGYLYPWYVYPGAGHLPHGQTREPVFGYPGFYPFPPYPFFPRRFRRRVFPLGGLLALSLLPYF
jgi:hypothetical protein